jgi:hypothetical protein
MKKCLYIVAAFLFVGCATVKEVPVNTTKVDSVRIEKVVEYRDTTIYVEVPHEVIKEVVPELDTLFMENRVATSTTFLDTTTRTLRGELKTKPTKLPQPVKLPETTEKEEIVTEIIREVPVTVEVEKKHIPTWCWYSLISNVVVLMLLGFRLYRKFIL